MDCLITNGKQYIRLDSNGSPQTCGQVLAERFSEDKAKNIIKNLPKPLRKFHFNVQLVSEIAAQPKPIEEEKLPEDINGILAELDDYYEDYQRSKFGKFRVLERGKRYGESYLGRKRRRGL